MYKYLITFMTVQHPDIRTTNINYGDTFITLKNVLNFDELQKIRSNIANLHNITPGQVAFLNIYKFEGE